MYSSDLVAHNTSASVTDNLVKHSETLNIMPQSITEHTVDTEEQFSRIMHLFATQIEPFIEDINNGGHLGPEQSTLLKKAVESRLFECINKIHRVGEASDDGRLH